MSHVEAEPWRQWQQQAVRDLAWVIGSPPLFSAAIAPAGTRWITQADGDEAHAACSDWLAALDRDPAPLLLHLAAERKQRLGDQFESLLAFWLTWPDNPRYRLLARNVPVRRDGITLGELDFLVEDTLLGETQHWEVAVKFYLGVEAGGETRHWIGPGLRDRLDLKLERLFQHQLPLSTTPEGQAAITRLLGPNQTAAIRPVCLLKGRLFYPTGSERSDWAPALAEPMHPWGWWQSQRDFLAHPTHHDLRWLRLPKAHWLTSVVHSGGLGPARTTEAMMPLLQADGPRSANPVIGLRKGLEVTRGFVVGNGWPGDVSSVPAQA